MAGPTLSPGAAFGRYALPTDDLAGTATVSASAEDGEYPASNLVAPTNTGHLNLPSRPAKLTTTSGYWDLIFPDPIAVVGAALIYHNFDEGLDVTLEAGAGSPLSFSQDLIIPAPMENGWTISPWVLFPGGVETHDIWRLSVNAANSQPAQVGRLLLLGALRDLENDVRWGVVEEEEQGQIEHATEAGVETLYELFGPRRAFSGELALQHAEASALITLYRTARNRILPWLLIPDEDVNDAWFVRFQEPRWSRTREMIQHNIFPFRVQELSRGLPWP